MTDSYGNDHTSEEVLASNLEDAKKKVTIGDVYHHYRNPDLLYKVLHVGIIEDSEEPCVIYESLYGDGFIWVRPIDNWLDTVEVDGTQVPRFSKK